MSSARLVAPFVLIIAAAAAPRSTGAQATPSAPAPQLPSVTLPPALDRVLRDYESAWRAGDHNRLSQLFTEDGFILPSGVPPIRGRAGIAAHYQGQSGPLHLRALSYTTADSIGFILGAYGYGETAPVPDMGKFTLRSRCGASRADGGSSCPTWTTATGAPEDPRPPPPNRHR
jgi:hypothetical protein